MVIEDSQIDLFVIFLLELDSVERSLNNGVVDIISYFTFIETSGSKTLDNSHKEWAIGVAKRVLRT